MGHRDPHADRTADVVQVQDEWPGRALRDERVDSHGHVVKGRSQDGRIRYLAISHSRVVGRDDMKPIRQARNEVLELVRRRRKTVQQDDGRLRRVPGFAVEDPKTRNVSGLEVHKPLSRQSATRSSWTLRYSSALFPKTFKRPGPKSVSPAIYCSGVKVLV